jgi:hypothetical protein
MVTIFIYNFYKIESFVLFIEVYKVASQRHLSNTEEELNNILKAKKFIYFLKNAFYTAVLGN